MLLDNKLQNKGKSHYKTIDFITHYLRDGKFDLVTGYFSVSALATLQKRIDGAVVYRMILGHLMKEDGMLNKTIDLLADELTIDRAIELNSNAKLALEFLKRDAVQVRTIQSSFCHAKTYIYEDAEESIRNFHIIGSSNLTASGMGINEASSNIELNYADTGDSNDLKELQGWFKTLWEKVAQDTIKLPDGKRTNFKQHIEELILKLHREYSPEELYYKVLFELFKEDLDKFELDPDFNRDIGHLQGTVIWKVLFEFQKKGVMSLIKMMKTHGGAILADAVGLGKTWQALAVMKYFEITGSEVILLCPKKLEQNWLAYQKGSMSKFENDKLDFVIRFHTDLQDDRLYRDKWKREFFESDRPKLFVIDESHNLRNDKSQRYQFLVENLLRKNKNVKVLLLSATPINNSLNDVRNQVRLLVKGNDNGFAQTLEIPKLDSLFRDATKTFNEWKSNTDQKLSTYIRMLKPEFFRLTDSLIVARTRKLIHEVDPALKFPNRNSTANDNQYITPENIGTFKSFNELFDAFPPKLSAYQPSNYVLRAGTQLKAIDDQQLQDRFLVKMMYILLTKRLESCWLSLFLTVQKVLGHHYNALKKVEEYKTRKEATAAAPAQEELDNMFGEDEDELTLGKREVKLADMEKSEMLGEFEKDLQADILALEKLIGNLEQFKQQIEKENERASADNKLEKLMQLIREKQADGKNSGNKKVVIFTCYKDSALYLYDELRKRGFTHIAAVTGQGSRAWNEEHEHKKFEEILQRFAPFTKLFSEKQWSDFEYNKELSHFENYERWKIFIHEKHADHYAKLLDNPLEILIATDCLSEGQNLQDADMVINYDVHWNPVRVLQRMGRIDRIGSPNLVDGIFGINFWPSDSIEQYIKLKQRVEDRMVQMKIAGIEIDKKFSERLRERLDDETLEESARSKMLKSFELKWSDIDETGEETFGFDDLSLENFRQELFDLLKNKAAELELIPNGVFTGFKGQPDLFNVEVPAGTVALLAYPARLAGALEHHYTEKLLAYAIPGGGTKIFNQKDILTVLRKHKMENRAVPEAIDKGEESSLDAQRQLLAQWMDEQAGRAGTSAVLNVLQQGKLNLTSAPSSETETEEQQRLDEKFRKENFDLITWFVVT